ncbi:GNAT family N-acetyltransferase [Paenibacillus sp. GCM10027626]|uniref:GNAT family N-acetyltransferase n=1 Tax=Paenibacillus sp. GCM10027626 TaxID=3273411 RepID=UPI003632618F
MQITALQIDEAAEICRWRYEGEYAFYNLEECQETISELLDGTYYGVRNAENEFIGFCCFGANAQVPSGRRAGVYGGDHVVDIGLGMKPELTGQGSGMAFLSACLGFARETFEPQRLRLSVAAFNGRAIRLYAKAGFEPSGRFDNNGTEFLVMERNA